MLFDDRFEVLNEAYYGKHKNLIQCERLFDEIIIDLKQSHDNHKEYDINRDPRVRKVEKLLESTFDLDNIDLTFYFRPGLAYNAFTVPTTIPILVRDKHSKYGVNSTNFRLNTHIDCSMLILGNITGGELLACLLHEIGHNFDASIFFVLSGFTLDIRQYIYALPPIKEIIGFIYTTVDKASTFIFSKVPILRNIFTTYVNISKSIKKFYYSFRNIGAVISSPQIYIQALTPHSLLGYGNEKFADSFATAHGYGKELNSFLFKLNADDGLLIKDVNAASYGLSAIPYDLVTIMARIALSPLDPHPQGPIRLRSTINKLKRDLEDPNLDPKLKKELKEQIREIEKFVNDDYTNIQSDLNKNHYIRVLYHKLLLEFPIDAREIGQLIKPREI